MTERLALLLGISISVVLAADTTKRVQTELDRYIREASQGSAIPSTSPGSLYAASGLFSELARDLRASQVNDLVTIVVSDRASALAKGTTNTNRSSSAKTGIAALAGPLRAAGALANLAQLESEQQLQGQGETSRETSLTTTLSARVTQVLPNGFLVLEGTKDVMINSERQTVVIRGIARWNDIGPANTLRSDRLANLEIRVQGKGVVGDAIRRPNFLYRLLLGLLPF
jgi:flagellar L-ring protein precursor FlgH